MFVLKPDNVFKYNVKIEPWSCYTHKLHGTIAGKEPNLQLVLEYDTTWIYEGRFKTLKDIEFWLNVNESMIQKTCESIWHRLVDNAETIIRQESSLLREWF